MAQPNSTRLQQELDAATDNDAIVAIIQQAIDNAQLDECATEAEAVARLQAIGFNDSSASRYASHHFNTFEGDCIDLDTNREEASLDLPPITPEMERLAKQSRQNLKLQKPVTLEEARAQVPPELRVRTAPYTEQ